MAIVNIFHGIKVIIKNIYLMIRKKLPFIIAEAGNNHEGNFKNARNLIIKAAETE